MADAQAAPLKRKRGRPRKNPLPGDAQAQGEPSFSAEADSAPIQPPTDYAPMISDLTGVASGFLVDQTGVKEIEISDEERARICIYLNPVLQKWFPNVTEAEMSPELMAVIGIGSIAVSKYMIFSKVQQERMARGADGKAPPPAAPAA
ncbi:MAG: hypothetical protein NDJ89_09630 [Oligoflexia bacterium]|nr:hypothetical protein [Oligoflexia bacterium]